MGGTQRQVLLGILLFIAALCAFGFLTVAIIRASLPKKSFPISKIRRISVWGNYFLSGEQVLQIIGFAPERTEKVEIKEWAGRLKSHRMVRSVRLSTSKDSLIIRLEEHRPSFRLVIGARKFWLTEMGELIEMSPEDRGEAFDAIRKQVSLRAVRADQFDDPAFTSLVLFCAKSVDEFLPAQARELKIDLLGNVELTSVQGIRFKLGRLAPEVRGKIEVIPQILRVIKSRGRTVELVDFEKPDSAVIKYRD